MLNELRKEIIKSEEFVTVENYDLEEVMKNTEEYYTNMSSLESTIETADLMVNILNKYEFKNEDELDISEVDAVFTMLGVNVSAVENDNENKVGMFKKIIEFIKKKLKELWKKIKSFISKIMKFLKIMDKKQTYADKFFKFCKKHLGSHDVVEEVNIIEIIKKEKKNVNEEFSKIINESYRYAVTRNSVESKLTGDTLIRNYRYAEDILERIYYFLVEIEALRNINISSKISSAFNYHVVGFVDREIYDYSNGTTYLVNKDFDFVPISERTVDPEQIKEVLNIDVVSGSMVSSVQENIKKKYEERHMEYILMFENKAEFILDNIIKMFGDEKSLDQEDLEVIKKIRKIFLVVIPRLIKIYITNYKYLINPAIETWTKYSYIYLSQAL